MYLDTLDHFAGVAEKKSALLKRKPSSFFIGAMMAGACVGLGIILIFFIGAFVDPSIRKLVMGATFGIALTLTVFAIALLGNHPETVSLGGMAHNLFWVTLGNAAAGSTFMAAAYWQATPKAIAPIDSPAVADVEAIGQEAA